MAGKKISQLTKLTELTGTEIIPVAKDGQNYGVETLALLGISVYDIPEPLDDNYIYTPEQLAEIKKSIEDGKIIRFGGWSMPTVYFLEEDGEMVFDIDNGDWSRVIFTIKANGEWEINPPVDFFNYIVEMPYIVEGEELTGTLPAETFGDLLERLKRSGNVMFRYPQAGGSRPVNQYDIGISFRYSQTNVTIIHAEGTREFSIIPSGNYTDRPVVSKQYQLITTRLNDYMYDMSGLLGKLAYRDGVGTDEKNIQGDGYFDKNGILVQVSGSGFVYQKSEVDPSKIYHIKQSNGIYSLVSILVLFDENDEIIQIIPYDYPTVGFDKYFIFKGVKSIGISFIKSQIDDPKFLRFESFDIQDLTTSINTFQGNRALYVAAGAVYNEQTGFYELNGLTDITEEQMKDIYVKTNPGAQCGVNLGGVFSNLYTRTNIPLNISGGYVNINAHAAFSGSTCEVISLSKLGSGGLFYPSRVSYMFRSCTKLKTIIGIIRMDYIQNNESYDFMFANCPTLVTVNLRGVKLNLSLESCPLLSLQSLSFLIINSSNTSAITITVHADVYAKIQDESNTDWHALLSAAQEKQITFATA